MTDVDEKRGRRGGADLDLYGGHQFKYPEVLEVEAEPSVTEEQPLA